MAVAHIEKPDPTNAETVPVPTIDRTAVAAAYKVLKAVVSTYHRAESSGVENVPDSGALLVGNHSGGAMAMDVPVIAVAFWDHFGIDRKFHTLAHDVITKGPLAPLLRPFGFVNASREGAAAALAAGGVTVVFPGGDKDAYRPWYEANKIDFFGRTGYVRTALEADVPIVPVVNIGGHEALLVLMRGDAIAKYNPFGKLLRGDIAPLTLGLLGLGFVQPPLPSKIVTRFLEPIHIRAEFGNDPDIAAVDELVRTRMQEALDEMAAARRFPVLG